MKKILLILVCFLLTLACIAIFEYTLLDNSTDMFNGQAWALGNTVEFGRYEQDAIYENDEELIEWRIIDNQGSRFLLVAEKGLDAVPYVDKENNGKHIIKWLNEDFYGEVFNLEEESMILETDMDDGWAGEKAKVFLLSTKEIKKYFDSKEKRILQPTEYAKNKMKYIQDDACLWWTRTGGGAFMMAAYVHFDGYIESYGQDFYDKAVVRPAMWVDIEKFDETIYSSLREQ